MSDTRVATAPRLPAVAVVDRELLRRRQRSARVVRITGALVMGTGLALASAMTLGSAGRSTGIGLVLLGVLPVLWSLPWAGPRTGANWCLGVEERGLRFAHPLAAGGQVFVPWPAIGAVAPGRAPFGLRVLRVRLRPGARPWLADFDPQVAEALLRRGFTVGLQGTSTNPDAAAALIARARPPSSAGGHESR